MTFLNEERRLLTGSADSELRAWDISYPREVSRDARRHVDSPPPPRGLMTPRVCVCVCVVPSVQEPAEGQPRVKKVKSLLEDSDGDDQDADESPEDVRENVGVDVSTRDSRTDRTFSGHLSAHLDLRESGLHPARGQRQSCVSDRRQ